MNIAIITGGENSEREISLFSAQSVFEALSEKYNVSIFDFPSQKNDFLHLLDMIDFVFVLVHGVGGEDGKISNFLDVLGKKYQTSDPKSLAITMDKNLTKLVRKSKNIPIADDILITKNKNIPQFSGACVLKALDQGSSVGVIICKDEKEYEKATQEMEKYGNYLIEDFLDGIEITVPIVDNPGGGEPIVLPVIEIVVPEGKEFDYENKYNGTTQEICPARLDDKTTKNIQKIALDAYKSLEMKGYGRIDMILTKNGPVCLELNSIPGFTKNSLFPKSAKAYGWSFLKFLEILMENGLKN